MCQYWVVLEVPPRSSTVWHRWVWPEEPELPSISYPPPLPTPNLLLISIQHSEGYLLCPIFWDTARNRNAPAAWTVVSSWCFPESQVGGERRREGEMHPCRVTSKYCPTPHVGPVPKHGRQSAHGKAGLLSTSMLQRPIRDLEFKR